MSQKKLQMTFDPNTIEHLGVRMYTTLPPVLAELIANAYDAYAENVTLTLKDKNDKKEIIIEDDGIGMSFDDINEKFLRIGYNRRKDNTDITPINKKERIRKPIGKKGLGKLSFFGIAHEVEITTRREGKETTFIMSWEKIKEVNAGDNYIPEIKSWKISKPKNKGTKIILRKIKRKTDFFPEQLEVSLSRMFVLDDSFKITVKHNDNKPVMILNDMKYRDLEKECEWKAPFTKIFNRDYFNANQIKGHLIATKKPIQPKTGMRGITLFSRTKLVNKAEYFSNSHSSHFFSYLTGYLEVDFIDDLEEDVIATNRQSLNWNHEKMQDLRDYLKGLIDFLQTDWRKKRTIRRDHELKEKAGINIPDWFDKLPDEHGIKTSVRLIVQEIVENSELSITGQRKTVERIHGLIPEYPKYHWRHLHKEVQDAAKEKYQNKDYYGALKEAIKRYEGNIQLKLTTQKEGTDLIGMAFGKNGNLTVTQEFKKPDGHSFDSKTTENIEIGQKSLSEGIITGCRHPLSHKEDVHMRKSGLFSEKDCLDALSLLSHLFRRLDKAQKKS